MADALSSIGISLEEVRWGAGEAFEMRIPGNRRLPFSPRAKKALEGALREARRLDDKRLTSEHVLLAILRNQDGTAVRILNGPWRAVRGGGAPPGSTPGTGYPTLILSKSADHRAR